MLLDRDIDPSGKELYLTAVTSDSVHEGAVAGEWLAKAVAGKACNVVELQGTVGASVATNRKKGFDSVVAKNANLKVVRSQTGDFTRAKGKEVMESFIKAEGGGKTICAVYAHNDDMMVGAIQAMKEAGLKPGKDVLTVSIDAVPDIFKAIAAGEANATVELTPNMAGPALDAIIAFKAKGTVPPKWIQTESKLYTAADDPRRSRQQERPRLLIGRRHAAGLKPAPRRQKPSRRTRLLRRTCRAFALTRTPVGVMPA